MKVIINNTEFDASIAVIKGLIPLFEGFVPEDEARKYGTMNFELIAGILATMGGRTVDKDGVVVSLVGDAIMVDFPEALVLKGATQWSGLATIWVPVVKAFIPPFLTFANALKAASPAFNSST